MSARSLLRVVGPGLLVAATGVGAGDLATGAFTGQQVGVAVLWAVIVGAAMKFALTEGLARWQIATGETVLEGALRRLWPPLRWLFALYLLPWTWFVGAALISACGATTHALLPQVFATPEAGKVGFGAACSLLGLLLVRRGGFALFERAMGICIGIMFATVVATAILMRPDWSAVLAGLTWPAIPDAGGKGLVWTLALIGGVGGTLTVLCYGYWIREAGRDRPEDLATCRIDLGVGYAATALFGCGMVIIGSGVPSAGGSGAGLIVALGDSLGERVGPTGRAVFLLGAWSSVFSSLLGVWQSVPYVFADFWSLTAARPATDAEPRERVDTAGRPYRLYLYGIATVPMLGLLFPFREVQKAYAIVGAAFVPLLALTLLVLNSRRAWVGARFRNRWLGTLVLVATLAFFVGVEVYRRWR